MYRRTQIFTLPEGSTATHWTYPVDHCNKFSSEYAETRVYGERTLSDDGRVWTTTQIWTSKEDWKEFSDHTDSQAIKEARDTYCNLHGITIVLEQEDF